MVCTSCTTTTRTANARRAQKMPAPSIGNQEVLEDNTLSFDQSRKWRRRLYYLFCRRQRSIFVPPFRTWWGSSTSRQSLRSRSWCFLRISSKKLSSRTTTKRKKAIPSSSSHVWSFPGLKNVWHHTQVLNQNSEGPWMLYILVRNLPGLARRRDAGWVLETSWKGLK